MNTTLKYRIYDTFNRRIISRHRSLKNAVLAKEKLFGVVRRCNMLSSYIPTIVEYTTDDGEWIKLPIDELHDAEHQYVSNW